MMNIPEKSAVDMQWSEMGVKSKFLYIGEGGEMISSHWLELTKT